MLIQINSFTRPIITVSYFMSIANSYLVLRHNSVMKHEAFARRFSLACKEANLPDGQTELGKCFGVSGPMVHSYRSGEKLPSMGTAIKIAEKAGVSVEWLLTGRGEKHPKNTMLDDSVVDLALKLSALEKADLNAVTALISSLAGQRTHS